MIPPKQFLTQPPSEPRTADYKCCSSEPGLALKPSLSEPSHVKKGDPPGSPPEKAARSSARNPGARPSLPLASPGCGSSGTRLSPSASPTCCRCLLAGNRGDEGHRATLPNRHIQHQETTLVCSENLHISQKPVPWI